MRPYYAKPSWSDRFRVRLVFAVVAELVVFVVLILGIPFYLWLLS